MISSPTRMWSGGARARLGDARLRRAPQHRLDARFELVDVERLGDEVVGAQFEAQDRVALLLAWRCR